MRTYKSFILAKLLMFSFFIDKHLSPFTVANCDHKTHTRLFPENKLFHQSLVKIRPQTPNNARANLEYGHSLSIAHNQDADE